MTQNSINNIQFSSIDVQTFISSGTYTPTTGMKFCLVTMVGGGGAGGGSLATLSLQSSAGGGGGSGGYVQIILSASDIMTSQTITVGTAGLGVISSNGGDGTASSIGTFATCSGGSGGSFGPLSDNDNNGIASPGDGGFVNLSIGVKLLVALEGDKGQFSGYAGSADYASSGRGGSTPLGNGGHKYNTIGGFFSGINAGAINYGGGGAGSIGTQNRAAFAGGDGAPGYVSILEFI